MFGFVLLILAALVADVLITIMWVNVARDKGYEDTGRIFCLCFFLGIIGWMYVSALPDFVLRSQVREIASLLKKKDGKQPEAHFTLEKKKRNVGDGKSSQEEYGVGFSHDLRGQNSFGTNDISRK